jgi:hypothetical protein
MPHGMGEQMVRYEPSPIDTSGVTLTDEIAELTERLAENTHDLWARQRMAEGWRYGPKRDDTAKEHPDLVPYGDLPDSEKEYDRKTAMETLRAIIALGYRINKD